MTTLPLKEKSCMTTPRFSRDNQLGRAASVFGHQPGSGPPHFPPKTRTANLKMEFRLTLKQTAVLFCALVLFANARLHASEAGTEPDLLALLTARSRPDAPPSEIGFPGRPIPSAPECEIIATDANGTKGIEKLQGDAAKSHLRNLMSRHPGRFSESERTLMEKGFWRTGDVVVLRSVTLGATESATELDTELDTARSNGPSISSSEGEIVFTSWDDGDPSTVSPRPCPS